MENMNFNQQMQNPNVPPSQPVGQMPAMPQMPMRKKSHWAIVGLVVALVVVFFVAWWYVSQMQLNLGPAAEITSPEDQAVREDAELNSEINNVDLGNLDSEFKNVDSDLNSL